MQNLPVVLSNQEIELLKNTYAKDLNDLEFRLFVAQAKSMQLNPFNKEIYPMKISGRLVLMTSIGGLRKIAHAAGNYVGCKKFVTKGLDGKILSATCIVKKLVKNHVAEFEATVLFDEYNSGSGQWKERPETMILKTAEAHALRMGWPALEELFTPDEPVIHSDEVDVDQMPESELESQEVQVEGDPGEFMVKFGSRKKNPTKLKNIPIEELKEFISWALVQENLTPAIKEYYDHAEAYLKALGN